MDHYVYESSFTYGKVQYTMAAEDQSFQIEPSLCKRLPFVQLEYHLTAAGRSTNKIERERERATLIEAVIDNRGTRVRNRTLSR